MDDGTTSRLAEQHFLTTTTTANAVKVMQHLEFLLQVVWPKLHVQATSVTEQWAAMALAGPNSRAVLERVLEDGDVSDAALPIWVSAPHALPVPRRASSVSVFPASDPTRSTCRPTMDIRFGKPSSKQVGRSASPLTARRRWHHAHREGTRRGGELDGNATAADLGLGRMVSTKKDFIGRRSLGRPGLPIRSAIVSSASFRSTARRCCARARRS